MAAEQQVDRTRRITVDPEIMVGKPVVKGTRIPVERVIAHLAHTPDVAELFAAYPELTMEDVKACLTYAVTVLEGKHPQKSRKSADRRPTSL